MRKVLCASLFSILGLNAAHAAPVSIDITVPLGAYSNPLVFGPMTVTSSGNTTDGPLQVVDANSSSVEERFVCGFFFLNSCGADLFLTFDAPIQSLTFEAVQTSTIEDFPAIVYSDPVPGFGDPGFDFIETWNDALDVTTSFSGPRRQFTLEGAQPFDRVYLVVGANSDFAAFGNFAYEPAAPVPLPAGLWFGLTGLAGFALMRKRHRASV